MIKIMQAQDPGVFDYLKDKLLEDKSVLDAESYVEDFKTSMLDSPGSVQILVGIDSEDKTKIKCFTITVAFPNVNFTTLLQAWSDKDVPEPIKTKMLMHTIVWTEQLGRSEIRAETERSAEALYAKWGFKQIKSVVAFDVANFDGSFRINKNEQFNQVRVNPEQEPAKDSGSDKRVDPNGAGSAERNSLLGPTNN